MVAANILLRPLTTGQIIDRAMHLYRRRFWTFIGIVAIVQLPLGLFNGLFTYLVLGDFAALLEDPFATPSSPFLGNPLLAQSSNLVSLVGSFFAQFANAAIGLVVAQLYLGKSIGIIESYKQVARRWQSIAGLAILIVVVFVAIFLWWIVIPCIGWLTGLGMLMYFSMVVVPLAIPVLILEGHGAWESLTRAWNLARHHFWQTFGLVLALSLFGTALMVGPFSIVAGGFGAGIGLGVEGGEFSPLIAVFGLAIVILTVVATLFFVPIQYISMTLLYFDLRVRYEAIDLAAEAMPVGEATEPVFGWFARYPQATATGSLVTSDDLWRFFGLFAGAVGIFVGIVAFFWMLGLMIGALAS